MQAVFVICFVMDVLGMESFLHSNRERGYAASIEIIFDIFMLAHGSTLIGVSSSQVRMMLVASECCEIDSHRALLMTLF